MKYMGSKARIAKHMLPIILKDRKEGQCYVEPFVGGANLIDKIDGWRIGADFNHYLISLWVELQKGWVPPDFVCEDLWRSVRESMDDYYDDHFIAFVRICCSFGSDWNGGYARNVRKDRHGAELLNSTTKSYCRQSKNNLMKQLPNIENVIFKHSSYDKLEIPPQSIIYCDPPYAGTTKYKDDFDHAYFWQWCRDKCKEDHQVFVSEYNAPADFVCVWQKEIQSGLNVNSTKKSVEKLFIHKSQK